MSKAIKSVTKAVGGVLSGGLTSIIPGVGKVIGGVGEVAGGDPKFKGALRKIDKDAFQIRGSKDRADRAQALRAEADQRSKVAMGQRKDLIQQLQAQASGTAPSLAEAQLRSAQDRNLAQQLAAAQSQRGGNVAATQRQLAQQQAQAGREVAQDAATARLQERESAQQLLGQQIGQEQQLADQLTQNYLQQGFNIEQARQQALADYEKLQTNQFLSSQGLTAASLEGGAQRQAGFLGGLLNAGGGIGAALISDKNEKKKIKKTSSKDMMKALSDEDEKKNIKKIGMKDESEKNMSEKEKKDFKEGVAKRLSPEKKKNLGKTKKEVKAEKDTKKADMAKKLAAVATSFDDSQGQSDDSASAGRALFEQSRAAISDINEKKDIKKDFLDKLQAYTYEYKNPDKPGARPGKQVSVMAQDLEKTAIGKEMVGQMEDGTKFVDYAKGYGAILAAQAHLNKRLDELEKKKRK